uniref:Prophage PssSM-02, Orf1 n=1 Tax=Ascaris lumbricoides TaxID=6252 RepID=A0A0M3I365_ASCLU
MRSLKSHDVNVIDENESVIARTVRIICTDCKYRSEKMGGCSIIGRIDDEVYTERNDEQIQYAGGFSLDLPPGAHLLIRDLAPKFYRQRFG